MCYIYKGIYYDISFQVFFLIIQGFIRYRTLAIMFLMIILLVADRNSAIVLLDCLWLNCLNKLKNSDVTNP